MAFSRPFAYNTGAPITGTTQFGDLIVGDVDVDYSLDYGGVKWWGGPDEDLRWVIGNARPGGQPVPSGVTGTAQVGFWGSKPIGLKNDTTFLNLANYVGAKYGQPPFATTTDAVTWLNANGFYTSYSLITPTPTSTVAATPTPTPTLTQTPTTTNLSSITTYTISACTSLNVLVADLGPGAFAPGDVFYLDFTGSTATECYTIINKINATPTDGSSPISYYPNCADCIDGTTTTYTISGCTNLNVLVADLGPGAFAPGDIFNMTFTGATPNGCYRIVNKIVASPTDSGTPLTFYLNCDACEASLVTPTPTATETPTPTPTVTPSGSAGSVVNMTLLEVGGDVVLSGAGTMNTTSLGLSTPFFRGSSIVPAGAQFGCGTEGPGPFNCSIFTGGTITQPANFGTGGQTLGSSASGDFFGIGFDGSARRLFVPIGYTSGSFISGTTTFNSTTLATLGATPGTYTWSWGSGANASSIILTVGSGSVTPTPTSTNTSTPTPSVTQTQTPSVTPTLTPTTTETPTPTPTSAATPSFAVSFTESGSDVLLSYSGALDLTGLNFSQPFNAASGGVGPAQAAFGIGPTGTIPVDAYTGATFSYPNDFGPGGGSPIPTGSGDYFGVFTLDGPSGPRSLIVPSGYTSNTYIAGTTTLTGQTFTSLGLSAGTYNYSWGAGAGQSFVLTIGGVGPTPTPTATSVTPTPTPTSGASGNFNVTISQVGPDVVWNGSGSFNLAALTSAGPNTIGGGYNAGLAIWAIGPSVTIDSYSGTITYPTSFGTGGTPVTSNTGSTFGILPGGSGRLLYVPSGYISNTTISGSSTYANQTISGMGLTPGTYTWSWGSGGNASSIVMTITP